MIRHEQYEVKVPVRSNDEVGRLSESINRMGKDLKEKEFIKETFGKIVDPSVRDNLLAGNIGSGTRMEYTAIGDTVNLCSRVESLTKHYGIPLLVTDDVVYSQALELYTNRNFAEAKSLLYSISEGPYGRAGKILAERCGTYLIQPLDNDWGEQHVLMRSD